MDGQNTDTQNNEGNVFGQPEATVQTENTITNDFSQTSSAQDVPTTNSEQPTQSSVSEPAWTSPPQQLVSTPIASTVDTGYKIPEQDSKKISSTQYLIAYILSLFLIASILSSLSTLINLFFANFDKPSSASLYGDYFSGFKLSLMIWSVSNLIVITPLYIFLLLKLRKYQPSDLTEFGYKVKNFAYGAFMVILGLSTLIAIVAAVFQVGMLLAPKGQSYGDVANVWWTGFASSVITAILLAVTSLLYYVKADSEK